MLALAVVAAGFASAALASDRQPAFRLRVLRFVDHSRRAYFRNGTSGPRVLVTYVRIPTRGHAPYPLVVFGHGFALDPARLRATARRVGARRVRRRGTRLSARERERARRAERVRSREPAGRHAPGDHAPARARHPSGRGAYGRIDPRRIAVAGHSDGAVTALAVAYDSRYRDPRVRAAIILSGAEMTGMAGFPRQRSAASRHAGHSGHHQRAREHAGVLPPRRAAQVPGAPDRRLAPAPVYEPGAQLRIVERVTIAFLDHYLKHAPLRSLVLAARNPGLSTLEADP